MIAINLMAFINKSGSKVDALDQANTTITHSSQCEKNELLLEQCYYYFNIANDSEWENLLDFVRDKSKCWDQLKPKQIIIIIIAHHIVFDCVYKGVDRIIISCTKQTSNKNDIKIANFMEFHPKYFIWNDNKSIVIISDCYWHSSFDEVFRSLPLKKSYKCATVSESYAHFTERKGQNINHSIWKYFLKKKSQSERDKNCMQNCELTNKQTKKWNRYNKN